MAEKKQVKPQVKPFDCETLDDALERLGRLDNRDFIFIIWAGLTNECELIARAIRITLPRNLDIDTSKSIIDGINSKVMILTIIDEHKNIYKILEAHNFVNKSCRGKDGGEGKKKTKGN
jgi:hypothetical protein